MDELKQPKTWGVFALIIASASGGSILFARPDPFTGTEAKLLEDRLRLEACRARPPERTRQRIRAIERSLMKLDPSFEPPTQQWGDPC